MPRDFKIGMLVGLVVVMVAGLWLSMRPSLSVRGTVPGPENSDAEQEEAIGQLGFGPNIAASRPIETEITGDSTTAKEAVEPKYHTVQSGDTLSEISYQYYGTVNQWQKILEANRNVITDAKNLRPGMRLIIPE